MAIGGYYIHGYWWLFMVILLMVIDDYFIDDYQELFYCGYWLLFY